MESFSFHFERMNNLDLHPLSLPISRLSPAKSNSSIVEQLAHHQHGKGDSAYSSFSGGSTAQDYPSPFIPDDLQPSSLSHYADIKYVRAIYQPSQVLQSHSKTMDQLCLSVEAISQQYHHNNNNINDHRQNGHNKYLTNKKKSFQEDVAPTQFPPPPIRPPPPPARLDSFVATRNLENSWGHHQGTELKPQQAQTQKQQMPYKLHPQAQRQSALKPQTANLDPGTSGLRSELVYGGWCDPQEPPQTLQPLSYRPHLQHTDRTSNSLNPEHLFTTNNKEACEQQQQQKLGNMLSRSPPQVMSQTEHQKHKPPASIGGGNGSSHFEGKHKRAHSTHGCLGPELNRVASPWNVGPNLINSSIQHKGHFYFITGMCKPTESGVRMHSPCVSEAGSETSTVVETYRLKEKDRCHSTMEHFFRPPQHRSYKSNDMIPNENQVATQDSFISSSHDENHNTMSKGPSPVLIQSSHSFDSLEQIDLTQSQEMARHTSNHPIFYCGPQENCPPQANRQIQEVIPIPRNEQLSLGKTEEQSKRGRKQQLGDVASKKINKETTPLLYHLTGASRVALKPKNDFDLNVKGKEAIFNKTGRKEFTINNKGRSPQGESVKEDQGEVFSHACNTLDDSFKKYYKERLKDAQSKVLRETSFKRRDLQLSWPHRIKQQKPEQRPSVIHSFSPSQDSETSTNTLTPSVTSVETEMGSVKEEVREKEKEKDSERENTRPVNMAQPQVARIGGRKRLTPEQKKMCYSEPEKLNQLGDAPSHSTCRSLGNEAENVFQMHCKRDEAAQHGEQPMGLVAARRKMFETRGRALSASSLSKTNLKHLQHKALVEYIERKTGQKVAEPQQPGPQLPPPSRQRHSIGEKPFDWSAKVQAASTGSKGPKNKLNRPHSAGRILDSSTSSIRYAQFFSVPFGSVQSSGQPIWKENKGPSQGKSASAENLLEQPEPVPEFLRNRSTSTPHAFQAHSHEKEPSVADAIETHSPQETTEEECLARPTPEGQQRIRINAQRGKSMEELGSSRFTRTLALSKSSEQLDQLQSHPRGPEKESNRVLFCGSGQGETDLNQKMGRKQQLGLEQAGLGLENIGRGKTRAPGKVENQAIKNPLSKRDLTSLLGSGEGAEPPVSTKDSPIIINSSQAMVHSSFPGSNGSATDELGVGPCSDTSNPPSPKGQDTSEKEIKSTSSTPSLPNQTEVPKESKLSSSFTSDGDQTSQSVTSMQEVEAIGATPPLDSNQEVSLSCGVTTDPLLWILAADQETEEESQSPPLTDNVFEVEPTSSASLMQKTEAPLSLSTSASDVNISHAVKGEKIPETMDEKSEEDHVLGESGTPEGETESSKEPDDKPQWEELVEAVVKVDQSLTRVLYPLTNRKTALMLMEQLLSEDTLLMEEHYKKKQEQRGATEIADSLENVESLPALPASDDHTAPCSEPHSEADITEKKHLLVAYIEERLLAMHEMRHALQTEIQENAVRGEAMLGLVRDRCPPVEVERYGLFIGDLERVVSLLLCLSARLARVQNALSTVDQHTDAEEKQSLDSRHRLLCKQRDDAKDLKDNLDRRESLVSTFLSRQLSERQLQDYRCFVQTQASLLIRQKDLEERQRLGEEQLEALRSSLPPP